MASEASCTLARRGAAAAAMVPLLVVAALGAAADLPYRFEPTTDYVTRIICNPCKFDEDPECCKDSYGVME
jgi:hypothetical protein